MPAQLDLEEILRRNPQIDRDELEEAENMLRRLREQGAHQKGYDLLSPFGGYRVAIRENPRSDRRLARLRRLSGTD